MDPMLIVGLECDSFLEVLLLGSSLVETLPTSRAPPPTSLLTLVTPKANII